MTHATFHLNQKGIDFDIKFLKQDPDTGEHIPFDISTASSQVLEFFREDKTSFQVVATKHIVGSEWFVQYINNEETDPVTPSILNQIGDWEVRPIVTFPNEDVVPGSPIPFEVAK